MACWLEQPTSNNDFCDAIDEIMKHEHEDVILLDDALSSGTPLELDLDSISDLLETPSTAPVADIINYITNVTIIINNRLYSITNMYDMTPTTCHILLIIILNQIHTTSAYSSLGISPKFTTLSINQHHHPFSPTSQDSNNSSTLLQPFGQSSITLNSKNNLHPPPYVQQSTTTR